MVYLVSICTLFIVGSLLGYVIEVLYRRFFSQKRWVNPGFLVGPYIPLYGFGVLLLYTLSNINLSEAIPILWVEIVIKLAIIAVSLTLIELIAGLIFIKGMHLKLWDYSNRWGNFKGIICPLFSLIWAIVGSLYYFFVNPYLVEGVYWISTNNIYSLFIGMFVGAMIVDACFSMHLGMKIKKFSNGLTIKYEDFKQSVKDNAKENKKKGVFFGTAVHDEIKKHTLGDSIKKHVDSLPKPKKWWKKNKDCKSQIETNQTKAIESKKSDVRFEKITNKNIWKVCNLNVDEHQKDFVAENIQSLAEAFATRNEGQVALPFAIYDNDTLVGFIMIGKGTVGNENESQLIKENYCIWRLMIDKNYQHKGYGLKALTKAIEMIKKDEFCLGKAKYCWLSYEKENEYGRNFYLKFGFKETNEMCGNEIIAIYEL